MWAPERSLAPGRILCAFLLALTAGPACSRQAKTGSTDAGTPDASDNLSEASSRDGTGRVDGPVEDRAVGDTVELHQPDVQPELPDTKTDPDLPVLPDIHEIEVFIDPCDGVDCNDGDQCTLDECNAGECVHTAHTGPCEDGNACTVGDMCAGGQCLPGEKLSCDDGNPCTDDACSSVQGCLHVLNTKSCSDGDPCTDGDKCKDGQCLAGTTVVCHPCLTDGDCLEYDDGDLCNGVPTCVESLCQVLPESVVECPDDPDDCVVPVCAPEAGLCIPDPAEAPLFCNDGDACTLDDQCEGAVCVGKPANCTDGDACTIDSCNPDEGCLHNPKCEPPKVCTDVGKCCTPMACGMIGMECGPRPDTCGGTVDCAECPEGEDCKDGVCSDGVCKMELVGTVGGHASDVAVSGSFAYVALGPAGLYVVDISDPQAPVPVGKETEASAVRVRVAEDIAVVSPGFSQPVYHILHVGDPTNPEKVAEFDAGCEVADFELANSQSLLVACENGDVHLVDLSLPSAPSITASFSNSTDISEITVSDQYVIVVSISDAAVSVDVLELNEQVLMGLPELSVDFPTQGGASEGFCREVVLRDGRLYILTGTFPSHASLRIFECDPSGGILLASTTVFDQYFGNLAVSGNMAYLSRFDKVQALDATDASEPMLLGWLETEGGLGKGVLASGNLVITVGDGGLRIVDVSNPLQPTLFGQTDNLPGAIFDAALTKQYLITAARHGGVKVYDVGFPGSLQLVSVVPTPGSARKIRLLDETAYVATTAGITCVDVDNPFNPHVSCNIAVDWEGYPTSMIVSDDVAYVATRDLVWPGLFLLVSLDIAEGTVLDIHELPASSHDMFLSGDLLYAAAEELLVVDVSDPAGMAIIGSYESPLFGAQSFSMVGALGYAGFIYGVEVLQLEAAPAVGKLSEYLILDDTVHTVRPMQERLLVAGAKGTLLALDVADPYLPSLLAQQSLPDSVCGLAVKAGFAIVFGGGAGAQFLHIGNCL